MKLIDDIEALRQYAQNALEAERILAEKTSLIRQHLPLSLAGTIFSSLCFFVTMFITLDLETNQKILNIIWLAYHTTIIAICWAFWQHIFKKSDALDTQFLKRRFATLLIFFIIISCLGTIVFIRLLPNVPVAELRAAKMLIMAWIFFHITIIGVCWFSWRKIKTLANSIPLNPVSSSNIFVPISNDKSATESSLPSSLSTHLPNNRLSDYLTHYSAYNILLICTLAIGCLWAMAIGKAFTTNLHNTTQVIVLMGLQFGLFGGAISSLAVFWRVYIALILPSVFMWGLIIFYVDDTRLIILAVAVLVLLFFNMFFAKHAWLNNLRAISIYLENTNLVSQLQVKTQQVEKASLARIQFLAAASHDLRQPVQALSLFIEALKDTNLDSQQAQILNYANSASQSSSEMLNSILDYAHLESGQMTPHFAPTNLNDIMQSLVNEFSIQAHNKQLSLRFRPTNIWVMTDPTMLALILRNLISNAIRYTQKGGILIGVRKLSTQSPSILLNYCRISVWDTGSGMTAGELERVFDSFYQLERNNTTNQGLGLGLAIVKGMTKLLKADLSVESKLNQGSQFSLVLPICGESNNAMSFEHTETDYLAGKTILVVDDDNMVLKSMQLLLEMWGCQTIVVQTLEDAVTAFKTHQPDIVITDFRLAGTETGEDVIIAIQNTNKPSILVSKSFIILTANTSPELFITTRAVNPIILHKPIDPMTLRHNLQQVAAR